MSWKRSSKLKEINKVVISVLFVINQKIRMVGSGIVKTFPPTQRLNQHRDLTNKHQLFENVTGAPAIVV